MKHSLKTRALSLLLALVLLFSLAPAAFAGEAEEEVAPAEATEQPVEEPVAEEPAMEQPAAEQPAEEPAAEQPVEEPAAEEPAEEETAEEGAVKVTLRFIAEFRAAVPADGAYADSISAFAEGENGEMLPFWFLEYMLNPGVYAYSAQAVGYKDFAGEFTVPEGITELTVELSLEAYPYGLKGMGLDYVPSEADIMGVAGVAEHGQLEQLPTLTPGVDYIEGEVYFLADTLEEAQAVAHAYGAELKDFQEGVALISLPQGCSVPDAVTASCDEALRLPLVQPNYIIKLDDPVAEPLIKNPDAEASSVTDRSWNWQVWKKYYGSSADPYLTTPINNYQYQHDLMNTYEAWGITTGSSNVWVAVIDSGVYSSHTELSSKVVKSNYYSSTVSSSTDENGHGTHCAGIIAAKMGNGAGGAGIAPGVSLMNYRALDANGSGSSYGVATGINWAVNNSADVISMSLGGYFYDSYQEYAIRNAIKNNVAVVVAAGNDGTNIKCYPGACNIPGMITVGAADRSRAHACYSNSGSWVDVYAPGTNILSTYKDGGYVNMSGTSMATPAVAGAVALYISASGYRSTSPLVIEKAVKGSVTNGILDAYKLVKKGYSKKGTKIVVTYGNVDLSGKYPGGVKIPSNVEIGFDTSELTAGESIVYTLDGTLPAFFNGALVNGSVYNGAIDISSFAPGTSLTITSAFASGAELGEITTLSYTVGDAVDFNAISLSAPKLIKVGESASATAEDYFGNNITGSVSWSVTMADGSASDKLSITDSGEFTANVEQECEIIVTATSASGAKASAGVTVWTESDSPEDDAPDADVQRTTQLKMYNLKSIGSAEAVSAKWDKYGFLKSVVIYAADIPTTSCVENQFTVGTAAAHDNKYPDSNSITYSINNTKVASFAKDGNGNTVLVGKRVGKVKLTVTAADSGKKTSITVTVKAPASYVDIKTVSYANGLAGNLPNVMGNDSSGRYFLTAGKSANHKAVLGDTYGKPSGVKTYWAAGLYRIKDSDGSYLYWSNSPYVKVSSGGKLTIDKRITNYSYFYSMDYTWVVELTCYAVSDNNYAVSDTLEYVIAPPITKLEPHYSKYTVAKNSEYYNYIYMYSGSYIYDGAFSVKSSNPDVCGAVTDGNYVLLYTGNKKGSATITVTSTDGTNKKCTFKVIVKYD